MWWTYQIAALADGGLAAVPPTSPGILDRVRDMVIYVLVRRGCGQPSPSFLAGSR